MTSDAQCISPDASLTEASQRLRDLDVGALPVCENERLVGMITDRDITVRAVAEHCSPDDTSVRDVMSEGAIFAYDDEDVRDAALIMRENQVRRLPVINRRNRVVGIISLGDLAAGHLAPDLSGATLRGICQSESPGDEARRRSLPTP